MLRERSVSCSSERAHGGRLADFETPQVGLAMEAMGAEGA